MEDVNGIVRRLPLLLIALLLTSAIAAAAQSIPALTQPVNDFANVIDPSSEQELDRRIRELMNATRDVVIVATVPTFKPYATIDEYAVKMFENGGKGIGERGKDNGLLIVVAVEDRKVRIETGYDIEGAITDGFAGQTIREVIAPAFREGRYGPGLVAATTRLINRIAEARGVTLQNVPATPAVERARPARRTNITPFIIFIIFLILASRRRRRRRRHWGGGPWSGWNSGVGPFGGGFGGFGGGFGGFGGRGGGGGGGFGGFGGGRSGGGGASGGW